MEMSPLYCRYCLRVCANDPSALQVLHHDRSAVLRRVIGWGHTRATAGHFIVSLSNVARRCASQRTGDRHYKLGDDCIE